MERTPGLRVSSREVWLKIRLNYAPSSGRWRLFIDYLKAAESLVSTYLAGGVIILYMYPASLTYYLTLLEVQVPTSPAHLSYHKQ